MNDDEISMSGRFQNSLTLTRVMSAIREVIVILLNKTNQVNINLIDNHYCWKCHGLIGCFFDFHLSRFSTGLADMQIHWNIPFFMWHCTVVRMIRRTICTCFWFWTSSQVQQAGVAYRVMLRVFIIQCSKN